MDQKTIQAGGIVTGVLLIFCGLLVSPVVFGLLASFPSEIWWLGLVLMASCGLMIYGGIQSIRKAKKQERLAREEQQRIQEDIARLKLIQEETPIAPRQQQTALVDGPSKRHNEVLAYWTFTATEWKKFMMLEKKRRKSSTLFETLAFVVLGTILLMYSRDATFWTAFWISLMIGLIIAALRYTFTMNSFGVTLPKNEVIITDQSVMINDKLNPYRSENYWLDKIQIIDGDPDVIEITYAWTARKGKTFDEMRVPIPAGKKSEAQAVLQKIINPYQ